MKIVLRLLLLDNDIQLQGFAQNFLRGGKCTYYTRLALTYGGLYLGFESRVVFHATTRKLNM